MLLRLSFLLDYLTRTLGLSASVEPWPEAERLPLYLRSGKKYSLLHIENEKCILIEADEKEFNLPAFSRFIPRTAPGSGSLTGRRFYSRPAASSIVPAVHCSATPLFLLAL